MLSQAGLRREYDQARRAPAKPARASPVRKAGPAGRTGAQPATSPRAAPSASQRVPSAARGAGRPPPQRPAKGPGPWAQQRAQEAAWEFGGERGAALARALRRQEKLRQEAAARARAALRQNKLEDDAPGTASSSVPGPAAGASRQAAASGQDDWEGRAHGVDAPRAGGAEGLKFDWSKMETAIPFLKQLRQQGAGVRPVRNEDDIMREVMRPDFADGPAPGSDVVRCQMSEWDLRRETLAHRRFAEVAKELSEDLQTASMDGGDHEVEGRTAVPESLRKALRESLWGEVLPEVLDAAEAPHAIKLVWHSEPAVALGAARLRDLLYAYFAREAQMVLILSHPVPPCASSRTAQLRAGSASVERATATGGGDAAAAAASAIVGGAVLVFSSPCSQPRLAVLLQECSSVEDGEEAGGELRALQHVLQVQNLRVGWVVGGNAGRWMRAGMSGAREHHFPDSDVQYWRSANVERPADNDGWDSMRGRVREGSMAQRDVGAGNYARTSAEVGGRDREARNVRRSQRERRRSFDEFMTGCSEREAQEGRQRDAWHRDAQGWKQACTTLPTGVQQAFAQAVEREREREGKVSGSGHVGVASQGQSSSIPLHGQRGTEQMGGGDRRRGPAKAAAGRWSGLTGDSEQGASSSDGLQEDWLQDGSVGYVQVRNLARSWDDDDDVPLDVLRNASAVSSPGATNGGRGVARAQGSRDTPATARRMRHQKWRDAINARTWPRHTGNPRPVTDRAGQEAKPEGKQREGEALQGAGDGGSSRARHGHKASLSVLELFEREAMRQPGAGTPNSV